MLAHHDGMTVGASASSRGAGSIGAIGFRRSSRPSMRLRSAPASFDGELIACDANKLADFQLLRRRKRDDPAIYCAFDLLHLDGRPRSYRDDRAIAIEAAEYLKYHHPHAEVTVLDLETGDTRECLSLVERRAFGQSIIGGLLRKRRGD
jgi:hypothetical protein